MRGFSLIELMVAISIVAVLVTLALPRYRVFQAKSRQAEAKINLGFIAGLQQTYKAEFEKYYHDTTKFKVGGGGDGGHCNAVAGEHNELGFRVTDCSELRYTYSSTDLSGGGRAYNDGITKDIYPGCTGATKIDEWRIDNSRNLNHRANVIKLCK